MNKACFIFFFLIGCFFQSVAQKITPAQYIAEYKDLAIREMKRMGVPAAITLAQGILETESGNSVLLQKSNNHFGIKCKSSWSGGSVSHDDDSLGECFRTYKDAEDSYRDHSNFLRGNDRYAFLFKLDPSDYKGWANGLKKAGYATNPRYPEILIKHIETYNLEQYTLAAIGEVPVFDASKYKNDPEIKSSDVAANEAMLVSDILNPATKLTINGSRALLVPKGTSLLAVATENNVGLSRLLQMNDLKKDGLLEKEQFIFLEKKQKEGNRNFCVAEPGESLYDLAQKNGILLQSLCEYNNLSPDESIVAGTKIFLRPQVMSVAYHQPTQIEKKSSEKNRQPQTHEVQAKEGLYSISKKYGVSISQIKEWNNLSDDNIKIGQQLIISK
jgi:LysM repeat protein